MDRLRVIRECRTADELEGVRWASAIGATAPFTDDERGAYATRAAEVQRDQLKSKGKWK